jgi:hypothetical protein
LTGPARSYAVSNDRSSIEGCFAGIGEQVDLQRFLPGSSAFLGRWHPPENAVSARRAASIGSVSHLPAGYS